MHKINSIQTTKHKEQKSHMHFKKIVAWYQSMFVIFNTDQTSRSDAY